MENLKQIVKEALEGNFVDAGSLVEKELNKRKEDLSKKIDEAVIGKAINESASASAEVDGLGKINLATDRATLAVASISSAVKVAPKFAAFLDGGNVNEYSARKLNSKRIQIIKKGNPVYDVFYGGGELEFNGNFDHKEVEKFARTGTLS